MDRERTPVGSNRTFHRHFPPAGPPNGINNALRIPPRHLQQAQAGLVKADILHAVGTKALALAAHCYHQPPQVSHTDALRRERNQMQDELETLSCQLPPERHQTQRLKEALAAALELPKTHQNKAYQLRKQLRTVLAVLQHPQAKNTTKLRRIAQLVTGALAGEEDPVPELLA